MTGRDKRHSIVDYGNKTLHIIDSGDVVADGEWILYDLVYHYGSHPGFMFTCRIFSQTLWYANYCWWLFTDDIAINFQSIDGQRSMFCWATLPEAQKISQVVEQCCPF